MRRGGSNLLEACEALRRAIGGLVVLVHHTGEDATKSLRAHSSLFASLGAAIEVTRNGDRPEFAGRGEFWKPVAWPPPAA
jgi:putative DNA primase/helicase